MWMEVIMAFLFRINQHLAKSTSWRNFLVRAFRLAEVGVVGLAAWITGVGWVEEKEVRARFFAGVVIKVVTNLGEGEVGSGAR